MIPLRRIHTFSLLLAFLTSTSCGKTFFVSPTGNDGNAGTLEFPFKTLQKAVTLSTLTPGDTIFMRGGVFQCSTSVSISKSGNASARYVLSSYPGERAVVDFVLTPSTSTSRGFTVSGSYWHIYGLDILRARDNGMYVSGSNNIVEFCSFSENGDTGLQLGGGASNNQIINCDSYYNVDPPDQGDADGFAPKLDVGSGNYFYGCRCWQNSDDGWDGYLRPATNVTTTLEHCWAFMNGYLKDGSASQGNGNGFKMGGSDTRDLMHNMILKNCVAFDNRVKGFDQNNNRGSMTLYNCTGYRNLGDNYRIASYVNYAAGKSVTVVNSVALGSMGSLNDSVIQYTNSWRPPFGTVTAAEFLSIDTTGMRGPRKPDGSLPDVEFLRLAASSQFVDAGTDVGLPFTGVAPDLGAFERPPATEVTESFSEGPSAIGLFRNYPNPFNPATTIAYHVRRTSHVQLIVVNLIGQEIARLVDATQLPGEYRIPFDATSAPSGVYVCRLQIDGATRALPILLLK